MVCIDPRVRARAARGRCLTIRQASLLVAIASYWLVFDRGGDLLRQAPRIAGVRGERDVVHALQRYGLLEMRYRRERRGRSEPDWSSVRPTAKAWAWLGERPR